MVICLYQGKNPRQSTLLLLVGKELPGILLPSAAGSSVPLCSLQEGRYHTCNCRTCWFGKALPHYLRLQIPQDSKGFPFPLKLVFYPSFQQNPLSELSQLHLEGIKGCGCFHKACLEVCLLSMSLIHLLWYNK